MSELQERMQELTSDQVQSLRRKAQSDLFFLAKGVLGYDQVTKETHSALCNFVVNAPSNRRMVLMPRGFLKSTICTISDSIRLALINPNVRILIANEVYDKSVSFLTEIKGHWMAQNLLTMLFPELVPERMAGPATDWSSDSASVNRSRKAKESTWNAIGVGGTAVSAHYEKIKCDDLAGNLAKESETIMQRTCRWTDDLPALLDNLSDQIDMYGTRKTVSDVYAYNMQKWKRTVQVFLREPLENGVSIFPKMRTEDLLNIMNDTPEQWAADYMNNPIGKGGIDWGNDYIQFYTLDLKNRKVLFTDPLTKERKSWRLSELDIVITVDPNSGKPMAPDKAAICVHGVAPDDNIFALETYSGRPSPEGLIDKAWELCLKWKPRVAGFEEAGQQNTLFYFQERCIKKQQYFSAVPIKHKNRAKDLRIRTALDTPLRSRKIFLLQEQSELIYGIRMHPQLTAHNWDVVDCFSNGPQLYRTGVAEKDLEEAEEAERKLYDARGITGYGISCSRSLGVA